MIIIFGAFLFGGFILCAIIGTMWIVSPQGSRCGAWVYSLASFMPLVSAGMLFAGYALSGKRLLPLVPCVFGGLLLLVLFVVDKKAGMPIAAKTGRLGANALGIVWSAMVTFLMTDSDFMGAGC